jgi:glycosidase
MAINQDDIIYFVITDRFYGKHNPDLTDIDKSKPRAFHGGNFAGLIEKLPYLKKLGITAIWITPVYLQTTNISPDEAGYHGYWALDFNAVDPHLYLDNGKYEKGSKLYLKDFVDEVHRNGLKIILDMVVNHTGYNHPSLTGEHNPTPIKKEWFNPQGDCGDNTIKGQLSGLPDFNLDLIDVSDYHITTILSWIQETGIDAIRMDTARHVEQIFWTHFKNQVKGDHPDVSLIGEVLEFDIESISKYQENFAFDGLFDFPMQMAIKNVFIYANPLTTFVTPFNSGTGILERDTHYTNHNKLVTLLDNHDLEARFMSLAMKYVGGEENRERALWIIKLALSFLFTIRGIPQLYYGTEYGMEGWGDPDNRRDFDWNLFDDNNDVKPEFFFQKEIFTHTQKLIKIRKANDALTSGNFVCLYVDTFVLVFLRYIEENIVITVIHNGWLDMSDPLRISIMSNNQVPSRIKELLDYSVLTCQLTNEKVSVNNGVFKVKMPRKSSLILK